MSDKSKMLAGAQAFCWVDLETTGTDLSQDRIIEIGAILTDLDLNPWQSGSTSNEFSVVIRPNEQAMTRMLHDDVVGPMHRVNGLIDECATSQTGILDANTAMVEWLFEAGLAGRKSCMIAGSGVGHFDRPRIDRWLPSVASLLVYPPMDIGVVRRFLRLSGVQLPDVSQDKTHRALDDARMHLEEARTYSSLVASMSHLVPET